MARPWTVLPHGPLEKLEPNLWAVEGTIKMPAGELSRRMCIARLGDGRLLLMNGVPLRDEAMREVERSEERRVGKECRSRCDWSSDVCSSDLRRGAVAPHVHRAPGRRAAAPDERRTASRRGDARGGEIGRASCRERV